MALGFLVKLLVGADDAGAEGIPAQADAFVVHVGQRAQEVHCHQGLLVFLFALGVLALAVADAAEVETQGGDAGIGKAEGNGDDDVVVHVAAHQGMGMAHHDAGEMAPRRRAGR